MDAALSCLGAFQASEQRQRACRRMQSLSRSVAEHWTERAERKPSQSRADSSSNSVPNQSTGGGAGWQGYIQMLMNICQQECREAGTGQGRHRVGLPTSYQFLNPGTGHLLGICIMSACTPCFMLAVLF